MSHSHQIDLYRILFMRMRRSVVKGGIIINAKPVFIIAVIDLIGEGKIQRNEIYFDDVLKEKYAEVHSLLLPQVPITPCYRPFFHLTSDDFWHIRWRQEVEPNSLTEKRLRDNAFYASFDNALWDVLQDADVREYYKKEIIRFFLTSEK